MQQQPLRENTGLSQGDVWKTQYSLQFVNFTLNCDFTYWVCTGPPATWITSKDYKTTVFIIHPPQKLNAASSWARHPLAVLLCIPLWIPVWLPVSFQSISSSFLCSHNLTFSFFYGMVSLSTERLILIYFSCFVFMLNYFFPFIGIDRWEDR